MYGSPASFFATKQGQRLLFAAVPKVHQVIPSQSGSKLCSLPSPTFRVIREVWSVVLVLYNFTARFNWHPNYRALYKSLPNVFGFLFSRLYHSNEGLDMASPASSNLLLTQASEDDEKEIQANVAPSKKGFKFWLVFVSMCTCLFLSALELCSVSTALPTIADALHASQFTWVGTAYGLAAAVFHPMSGGIAQTYGRRPALLLTIGLFALGSAICGAANSMNMLIAGRTIQGLGGGGIQSLTTIILADLVTLQERGLYVGLYGL